MGDGRSLRPTVRPGSECMRERRYDGRDQDGARRHRPPSRLMLIAAVLMIVASVVTDDGCRDPVGRRLLASASPDAHRYARVDAAASGNPSRSRRT